jgi:dihydrofolate synthase / folylpolyglutamate synthase
MEYSNALEYLYSLEKFGIVFGLENIRWLLGLMDNPHGSLKTVHVGGTNGKGSVACMVSSMLQEEGYKVGTYTSPHLVSFTERVTVNRREISVDEVADLTAFLRKKAESKDKERTFTFFDFTTALAFEYFRREDVDISVVEVGLGGRLDSTNVVQPLVSVITNVAFDHMDYLGDHIDDIAREKAGIIKEGVPVVTGARDIPLAIIEETARVRTSPLSLLGADFSYVKAGEQRMSYRGLACQFDDIFVNLRGDHQLLNGAVALCATEHLASAGFPVGEASVRRAMGHIVWPGRLEVVCDSPTILLDGAHNPDGTRVLEEFLRTHYRDKRKVLIFGVMKDKDYRPMLARLAPLMDTIILTRPNIERALDPSALKGSAGHVVLTENLRDAIVEARKTAGDRDLIVITGSLYTVGEAKRLIHDSR